MSLSLHQSCTCVSNINRLCGIMENDNFNSAFERYSEKHQKVNEDVVSAEPEDLDQQYHREEVTPKLREDFINYIENRFSSDNYIINFNHTKSCSMIVYGDYTVGIEI